MLGSRTLRPPSVIALRRNENLLMAPTCAPRGVPDRPCCEVQNSMCRQTLNERSERERQFALSCPKPVEYLPCPLSRANMQIARHHAYAPQTTHCGLRSDDLDKTVLRLGGLNVVGDAPAAPIERNASADGSWFDMSANAASACSDFAENSALDLPRSRSSELIVGAERARSRSGLSMSEAITAESKSSFRDICEHGVGPFPRAR